MNLLMMTRRVDRADARAGHTYPWVSAMARQLRPGRLDVVCLERGDTAGLPMNVTVHSLGKESGGMRIGRWLRFPFTVWPLLGGADAVFCHQNPEYALAVWPWAKLRRKRLVAWYTHGTVTWKTRLMARLVDVVLTASPESFRVPSPKVQVVGHGIDTEVFRPAPPPPRGDFTVVSVGRISPTKDYETLIKAVAELHQTGDHAIRCDIIGAPALPQDEQYLASLRELVSALKLEARVRFAGPVAHADVARVYQSADCLVNLSGTGSLDKAVLEAMACEVPVITSNPAFAPVLPSAWVIPGNDFRRLAEAIRALRQLGPHERQQLQTHLREIVVTRHNLTQLVGKILAACGGKRPDWISPLRRGS